MNLIIDLGNTASKFFLYDSNNLKDFFTIPNTLEINLLCGILQNKISDKKVEKLIVSSVIGYDNDFIFDLKNTFQNVLILDSSTNIPIKNLYETPHTLGYDRIAGVVGANYLYPKTNLLVVDAGTAITYDFINDNEEYFGGNISPGIDLRFKALNTFTKKLPLVSRNDSENFIGANTEEAIRLGVQNGLIFEIQGYIDIFQQKYKNNKIILTGGDCFFFDKKLKRIIFAQPNLISIGLNRILEYND